MEQRFKKANSNNLPAVNHNMILHYFPFNRDYVNLVVREVKKMTNTFSLDVWK